jgi:hypothetical protein
MFFSTNVNVLSQFRFQAGGADKQKQGPRESGRNLFHCLASNVITPIPTKIKDSILCSSIILLFYSF